MRKPKRRLPVLVETSVGRIEVLRSDLDTSYRMSVHTEVPKNGYRITCTAGCAHCCYHPISISVLEGILIYRWLVRSRAWTLSLKEKLKDTSSKQFGTSFEVWLRAMIPCPLLTSDNRCSVYPARPLICRAYYAISDPHYCHPHRLGDKTQILPRDAIVDPFLEEQERILSRHRVRMVALPIGYAILLAERVCTGEIEFDSIDSIILRELGEKT